MNTTKCEEIYVARLLTFKVLVIKTNANKVVWKTAVSVKVNKPTQQDAKIQ